MAFHKKIKQIEKTQNKIFEFGKLSEGVLQKINYKFRLDWNYYSNRMEGNTLTIEETKNVMIGNIDVHNKPIKDVMEMLGHDKAIQTILKIGTGELNISESRIKDLHKAIMYEDNLVDKEKIGKWKDQPNHVINYKNEKYEFTDPSNVAQSVHQLIDWLNIENDKIKSKKEKALHPVELAFEFHLRYLTIHPFYDGNGRTGRILTNLILIRYGFPPIYIKDNDKTIYYRYLADVQAYGADKYLLFDIMSDYLLRSLTIVSDAIDGKEINEPDDLDKKIQLLQMELDTISSDDEVKIKYSEEAFFTCYKTWMTKFMVVTIPIIQKFNKLFTGVNHRIYISQGGIHVNFVDEPIHLINQKLTDEILSNHDQLKRPYPEFCIQTFYGTLIKGGLKSFGCNYSIVIRFHEIKYEVFVDDFDEETGAREPIKMHEKLLHQALSDEEMKEAAEMFGNTIFKHIDYSTKRNGLRS